MTAQPGRETATIRCEACRGYGVVDRSWTNVPEIETCALCNGTGREPSAVHPRREGEKK